MKKFVEELEKDCFLEDINNRYNKDTVDAILEAVEHPETLHKLNSWEELGL